MNLPRAEVCAHLEQEPLGRLSVRGATANEFACLWTAVSGSCAFLLGAARFGADLPSAGSGPACLASVRLLYSTDGAGSDVGSGERQLLRGLCAGELDAA